MNKHVERAIIVAATAALILAIPLSAAQSTAASGGARPDATCTSGGPCLEWDNTNRGPGVTGTSKKGTGLVGQTSSTSTTSHAGVQGIDASANTRNSGVMGSSSNGNGVLGSSNNANGVQGTSSGAGASGVYGENDSSVGYGLAGRTLGDGIAVLADKSGGIDPALRVNETNTGCPSCTDEIEAIAASFIVMSLDTGGNMFITGTFTHFGPSQVTTQTSTGRQVVAYGARTAEPKIEDFGEAQLVDGQASVRLDPAFAATIDMQRPYMVFLTPDGPTSGGLYVAKKTATGFSVRENGSGRSSIAFDYRIVAKPYGDSHRRLPSYVPRSFRPLALPARANATSTHVTTRR